jgi:two-component system, cell cycle response regulator
VHPILILSKDTAIRDSTAQYLSKRPYVLKYVSDADEALSLIGSFKPEVILADISSEGMDGQTISSYFAIDVIVMTEHISVSSLKALLQSGAADFIFKPFRLEELDFRIQRVIRDAAFRKANAHKLKRLEKLSITDALSGLYNSRYFFSQIRTEIKRSKRYSRALSLLMLDIDNFKYYNDSWGHLEGDKVLMGMGRLIKSCKRSMDTAYRYGGDEFAVLLPETTLREAYIVGARIKDNICSLRFKPAPETIVSVSVSIGVAELMKEEAVLSFIRRADKALYESKS